MLLLKINLKFPAKNIEEINDTFWLQFIIIFSKNYFMDVFLNFKNISHALRDLNKNEWKFCF